MELSGFIHTIIKATVTCACGQQIHGGHPTNEMLASKDALANLRFHQRTCAKDKTLLWSR